MRCSALRRTVLWLFFAAFAVGPGYARTPPSPPTPPLPNLYLISIGISQYLDASNRLQFPAQDAVAIAHVFQDQQGKLFGRVVSVTLTDRKASRDAIIGSLVALRKHAKSAGADDYTIVFAAGHATNDDLSQYFFAPYDVDADNVDSTGVDWGMFSRSLDSLPGHTILMLDTGHAAAADIPYAAFLAACGKSELSQESQDWGHEAFTKALLEGLNGQADSNHDRTVTLGEPAEYVGKRVATLTKGAQHPVFSRLAPVSADLPVAIVSLPH